MMALPSLDLLRAGLIAGGSVAALGSAAAAIRIVLRGRVVDHAAVSDVRDAAAALSRLTKACDPLRFIDLRRGIFLGHDQARRPIYWPRRVLDKNHVEIVGETGVGKSSLAGVLLSQLSASGETVVIFDPKFDRLLPGVLARAGREWGRYEVNMVDLRLTAGPQLNPFRGCRHDQVEELLQVGLELGKTGDAAVDFYRGGDREATAWVAEACAAGSDIRALISAAAEDERVTERENLWRELRQLGRIPAFHTTAGLDLNGVLSKPGVLYIVGSTTRLEVVAAQKLVLQRVMQILDEREDQSRPVALFLDELKYILSPAALRAAGTIRDRNCHLLFAHQSLGDLNDCPGLDPAAVHGAIWGNTGLKFVYKVNDDPTAQMLSRIAGKVTTAVRSTTRGGDGRTSSTTRDESVPLIPQHVFTHLPKPEAGEASVGVLLGREVARYVSTRWLPAGPTPKPAIVAPPPRTQIPMRPPAPVESPAAAIPVPTLAVAKPTSPFAALVTKRPSGQANANAAPTASSAANSAAPAPDISLDDLLKRP